MLKETVKTDEAEPIKKDSNKTIVLKPFMIAIIGMLSLLPITIIGALLGSDLVFPLIGMIALFLSFRLLSRENKYFKFAFIIVSIRCILGLYDLIIDATIYQFKYSFGNYFNFSQLFYTISFLLILVFMKKGIMEIQKKAHTNCKLHSINIYIIFVAVHLIGDFITNDNIKLAIEIISMILTVYLLIKLFKDIKEIFPLQDFVQYTKPKISNKLSVFIIIIFVMIGLSLSYTFANSYPMHWTQLADNEQVTVQDIKHELIKKGFPEMVLNDLDEDDIKSIENAEEIVFGVSKYDGSENVETDDNTDNTSKVILLDVIVKLPNKDDKEYYKIFHYFTYKGALKSTGTHCMQIFWDDEYGIHPLKTSGRLLYDDEKSTYTAPFYNIYISNADDDLNKIGEDCIIANYSLPQLSENPRGYVSYMASRAVDSTDVSSYIVYAYQKSLLQYPVMTAEEYSLDDSDEDSYFEVFDMMFSDVFTGLNEEEEFTHEK